MSPLRQYHHLNSDKEEKKSKPEGETLSCFFLFFPPTNTQVFNTVSSSHSVYLYVSELLCWNISKVTVKTDTRVFNLATVQPVQCAWLADTQRCVWHISLVLCYIWRVCAVSQRFWTPRLWVCKNCIDLIGSQLQLVCFSQIISHPYFPFHVHQRHMLTSHRH